MQAWEVVVVQVLERALAVVSAQVLAAPGQRPASEWELAEVLVVPVVELEAAPA